MSKASFKNCPPTGVDTGLQPGVWVKCKLSTAFGVVQNSNATRAVVKWAGGESTTEEVGNLAAAAPEQYLNAICDFAAKEFNKTRDDVNLMLDELAGDAFPLDLNVLSALEQQLLSRCSEVVDSPEEYEECWNTIEQTAQVSSGADIFALFEQAHAEEQQPEKAENLAEMQQHLQQVTDELKEELINDPAFVNKFNNKVFQLAQEKIKTEAGLIDPETGELLEESLIMRKFGWSEMPTLPDNPTKEDLDAYQTKIDQVGDLICGYRDTTTRWTAANENRCKPLNAAADFFDEKFFKPMAKNLGKHRMPKRGKTLHLPSCSVKYTQQGGAYVHDSGLVKQHIAEKGVEAFASIDAEQVISYDYNKLLSALNNGKLKDIPGTGIKPKDPIAKVTVVSPKAAATSETEDAGES